MKELVWELKSIGRVEVVQRWERWQEKANFNPIMFFLQPSSHYKKLQELQFITQLQGSPQSKLINMFSDLWGILNLL